MGAYRIKLSRVPVAALALCLFAGTPRNDRGKVIGPGGGGSVYAPTISPHSGNDMLADCLSRGRLNGSQ